MKLGDYWYEEGHLDCIYIYDDMWIIGFGNRHKSTIEEKNIIQISDDEFYISIYNIEIVI